MSRREGTYDLTDDNFVRLNNKQLSRIVELALSDNVNDNKEFLKFMANVVGIPIVGSEQPSMLLKGLIDSSVCIRESIE